jgi:hypothetical protein
MSAVVGDVGQMGSLFAGLAAIVLCFSLGHPQAGCAHLFGFSLLIAPPIPSSRAATAQQVNDENHECNHQQQMNQTSGYVKTDSQKPENQKNRHNPPSESHCHFLRRNMRAQYLHFTNGYQATLLATVQTANPMGCVAHCENYCTSAEMLTLQFL